MAKAKAPSPQTRTVRESWLAQIASDAGTGAPAFKAAWSLSNYMHEQTRQCWPSQAVFAAAIAMSDRAVRDALTQLEQRGHLHAQRRQRETCIYTMLVGPREVAFGRRQATGENWQAFDDGTIKIVVEEPVEVPF